MMEILTIQGTLAQDSSCNISSLGYYTNIKDLIVAFFVSLQSLMPNWNKFGLLKVQKLKTCLHAPWFECLGDGNTSLTQDLSTHINDIMFVANVGTRIIDFKRIIEN